jgi:ribosome-binding protein aMBF1 (putative translation factor)
MQSPAIRTPEALPSRVIYGEFGLPSSQLLRGSRSLADVVAEFEGTPGFTDHMVRARQELADVLDELETVRKLRLLVGLSQAKLALEAGTQQSYVARLEAGKLDPGTDMIARLAEVLGVDAARFFAAVRNQRRQQARAYG